MKPVRVLIAGDGFVTPTLVREALQETVGGRVVLSTLELAWPHVPFGPVAEVNEASGDEDELIAALHGVEVIVTQMAALTERVLAAAHELRLIVVCRGGPVNVNLEAATARGIAVCATPGRNAIAAAEHTIALTLAALRRIAEVHPTVAAGEWHSELYALESCGEELAGQTVGVVGYGAIGRRVAAILSAFGSRVLVHDPYIVDADETIELVELDELLSRSFVVTLHARATRENWRLIGQRQIAAMPRGALLVNTARGSLLDYDALAAALHSGRLGGAALDVFEEEPIAPGSAILRAPHVVLTPHLAGATRQTAERAATMAAASVDAYLRSHELPGLINPEFGRHGHQSTGGHGLDG